MAQYQNHGNLIRSGPNSDFWSERRLGPPGAGTGCDTRSDFIAETFDRRKVAKSVKPVGNCGFDGIAGLVVIERASKRAGRVCRKG